MRGLRACVANQLPGSEMAERVYDRAPLVEVIAEIHWQTKPLASTPNAHIDPYYELFRDAFLKSSEDKLGYREQIVPTEVPVELVADQPHIRLRPSKGGWPLVQLGPGLMTANIVPRYKGWADFSGFLAAAIDELYRCYPLSERTLRITRTHLRYIDVFDETHGLTNFSEFIGSNFGIGIPIKPELLAANASNEGPVTFSMDAKFPNKTPQGSTTRIKINPGQSNGKDVAVCEFHCDGIAEPKMQSPGGLLAWFNEAHQALHLAFEASISEDLKSRFGKLVEVTV